MAAIAVGLWVLSRKSQTAQSLASIMGTPNAGAAISMAAPVSLANRYTF